MFRFSDLKTKHKVLIAVISPLVFLPVLGGVAMYNTAATTERSKLVEDTHTALEEAHDVMAAAVAMESSVRGYLLAGQEQYLEPFNAGLENFGTLIAILKEDVADEPEQVARLEEAESAVNAWVLNAAEPAIALRREIGDAQTMNDLADMVQTGRGQELFEKLRDNIALFIRYQEDELFMQAQEFNAVVETTGSFLPIGDVQRNVDNITRAHQMIGQAKSILAAALDMETGMRGYLLAGRDEYLEPYRSGRANFNSVIENLKTELEGDSEQIARLDEMVQIGLTWRADVADPMIELRRQIGDAATMDDMADLVAEARGKVFFDRFRDIMIEFQAEEKRLIAERLAESGAATQMTYIVMGAGIIVALLLGAALAWVIGGVIAKPVVRMTASMRAIADGDSTVEVFGSDRKDEIGDMAEAVEVFKQNAAAREKLEAEQARKREADERRSNEIASLIGEFDGTAKRSLGNVSAAAEQMKSSATSMSSMADDANQRSSDVASAAEQASMNVQTVATAAEEMSASVDEISRQVAQSAQMASEAVARATSTNEKVERLADAAEKIGEVVDLISDIAAQTNLLALNATIEASRAGEAGKGFAVVASEVKSLASQTAKATEDISAQITAIQSETRDSVGAIRDIGKAISDISETATVIASAVEEQGAATREIAANVQQAASGTQNVSSNIVEVARGAQETGSASQQVLTAAEQLSGQSDELQAAVASFLDRVKAA